MVAGSWFEQNFDTVDGWRAEAAIGLKHAVVPTAGGWTFAIQPSALWMSHPPLACSEGGAELRGLGGRSLSENAFLNVEAAARVLDGGCSGGRLDLTAGYRPAENWLALGQVFLEELGDSGGSARIQVSITRFGEDRRAVQLGFRARVDGDDWEPALVLGIWGKPDG